jgi:hypothetical protein
MYHLRRDRRCGAGGSFDKLRMTVAWGQARVGGNGRGVAHTALASLRVGSLPILCVQDDGCVGCMRAGDAMRCPLGPRTQGAGLRDHPARNRDHARSRGCGYASSANKS